MLLKKNKKSSKIKLIVLITCIIVIISAIIIVVFNKSLVSNKSDKNKEIITEKKEVSKYKMISNSIEPFDLYFLQEETNGKNMIYSPLSIKYALHMLAEGANGETKEQITDIIGDYKAKKYVNSKNMSFANALFVKDTVKNSIKQNYVNNLNNKYNAEVIYDYFKDSKKNKFLDKRQNV